MHSERTARFWLQLFIGLTVVVAALGAIGLWLGVDRWWLTVVSIAIVGATSTLFYVERGRQRSEIDTRLVELIDNAGMFVWRVDQTTGRFVSITGHPDSVIGWSAEQLTQFRWADLATDGKNPFGATLPENPLLHTSDAGTLDLEIEHQIRDREGRELVLCSVVHVRDGSVSGRSSDITDRTILTAALRREARHDALTGLANRAQFTEVLDATLAEHCIEDRSDPCDPNDPSDPNSRAGHDEFGHVGLLQLDLNRFKAVNDTLGHHAGDVVLQQVAERLREAVPAGATAARVGGDEFAVVVPSATRANLEAIAQTVHDAVRGVVQVGAVRVNADLSVGGAIAPQDAETADDLMRCADAATYAAKQTLPSVKMFDPALLGDSDAALLTSEVPFALDDGQFELWFEPIVSLRDLKIVGVEGLARWRHPRRGVLLPGDFLALLEIGNEEQRFADQMVEQAIAFAARATARGHDLRVSVNLGLRLFVDSSLPDRIAELLDAYGVPANQLVLEVTEIDVLDDNTRAIITFDSLAKLGVSLSIDDFGMGYSSFDRLRSMPLRELKIDRSFVQRSGTHPEDLIIVRTVTELARLLHLVVVGEGIETQEQLARLHEVGCDLGQGWLFSKALVADLMLDLLTRGLDLKPPDDDSSEVIELATTSADRLLVLNESDLPLSEALRSPDAVERLGLHIFEHLPFAAFLKTPDGRFVWSNRAHLEMLEAEGPLVDSTDAEVHDASDAQRYRSDDLRVITSGEPLVNRAEPQRRPDGSVVELRTTKVPIRDESGEVVGLFGYFFEVGPLADAS